MIWYNARSFLLISMNPNDQKDVTSDTQVSPWYTNFLLPAGLIVLLLLAGALYFGYQSYSASKVPKLPTESPSNINYPQVSASGMSDVKQRIMQNSDWYSQAYRQNNPLLCDKITVPSEQQACRENLIEKEAGQTGNIWLCDKLSSESRKIACKNPLYYREAVAKQSSEICQKIINDENYQAKCISELVFQKLRASSTGSLAINTCDILSEEYKSICVNQVKTQNSYDSFVKAQSDNSVNWCDVIASENLKIACRDKIYLKQAMEKRELWICDQIHNSDRHGQCKSAIHDILDEQYYTQAREKQDSNICAKINNMTNQENCYDSVYFAQALKLQDVWICDKLHSDIKKNQCQWLIIKK